ncbi:MAG: hypothetical protein ACQEVA_20365 [Myxococcota bacterium]
MKHLACLVLCSLAVAAPGAAFAQSSPRTLADVGEEQRTQKEAAKEEESQRKEPIKALISGDASHGDYGGPSLKLSSVDGDLAMFLGARGGWIIDHTVVLGLAGYMSVNDIDARQRFGDERATVNFDYWGVFGEYIISTNDVLHLTLDLFGGAGRAFYEPDSGADPDAIPDEHTSVFVGEASVNGELNITKHLRLTLGGGYRHVEGPSLLQLSAKDLSGFTATATFKIGIF